MVGGSHSRSFISITPYQRTRILTESVIEQVRGQYLLCFENPKSLASSSPFLKAAETLVSSSGARGACQQGGGWVVGHHRGLVSNLPNPRQSLTLWTSTLVYLSFRDMALRVRCLLSLSQNAALSRRSAVSTGLMLPLHGLASEALSGPLMHCPRHRLISIGSCSYHFISSSEK